MAYTNKYLASKLSKIIGYDKKILNLLEGFSELDIKVKNINDLLKLQNDTNNDLNKINIYLNNKICNLEEILNNTQINNNEITEERNQFNIFKQNILNDLNKKNIRIKELVKKTKNFDEDNENQVNKLLIENNALNEKLKLYMNRCVTENINLPLLLQSIINSEIIELKECGDEPLLYPIDFKNGDGLNTLFNHSEKLYNKLLNIGKNKGLKMGTQLGYCDVCIIFRGSYKEDIDAMYNMIKCTNKNISIDEFIKFLTCISKDSLKKIFNCYIK